MKKLTILNKNNVNGDISDLRKKIILNLSKDDIILLDYCWNMFININWTNESTILSSQKIILSNCIIYIDNIEGKINNNKILITFSVYGYSNLEICLCIYEFQNIINIFNNIGYSDHKSGIFITKTNKDNNQFVFYLESIEEINKKDFNNNVFKKIINWIKDLFK